MQMYLAKMEARLEMIEDCIYLPQRLGDEHIMSKVCLFGQFKDRDIQLINYCRMYLNVTTLSDIVLADRKMLDPYMYNGERSLMSSQAQQMKINQAYPSEISWRLWQKLMKLWTKTRTFPKPIGRWMVPSNQVYCVWLAYYEFSDDCFYAKQSNRYVQYNPDKENIYLFVNGKDSNWTLTDTSASGHIHTTDGMVQQDSTFQMHLDFLEDWESSLLQNLNT
eukprot:9017371-Ditylum_brightwellii.AAC.1